jgi:prepilin-type N-terminal cleavage/methylation domain-containing protein
LPSVRGDLLNVISFTTYGVFHMTQSTNQIRQSEGGFTLVELAIVMIIIGLLIGGILKGQELITNARVSSTVAQVKATESGISGFRDKYNSLPGDMNPNRLPNCGAGLCVTAPAVGVAGDGVLSNTGVVSDPGLAVGGTTESGLSFIHLAAAGLIGGVNPGSAGIGVAAPNQSNPVTPLGGAWAMGTSAGVATGVIVPAGLTAGVYMITTPNVAAAVPNTNAQIMTPSNAATIDTKLDDGQPLTGSVRAVGLAAAGLCSLPAAGSPYQEALGGTNCGIIAKVQ